MAFFGKFYRGRASKPPRVLVLAAAVAMMLLNFAGTTQAQTLLVFGDSLVAGYGLESGQSFPDELKRSLVAGGRSVDVVNGGISGDTTAGGASRIDWALADRPDAVMVVLGGNDALRGLEPSAMEKNLDSILEAIQEEGLPLLLAGMKAPSNLGPDYGREFDTAFDNVLAKARKRAEALGLEADEAVVFYPFFLDGVALDPDLNQSDGIHPNIGGVAEITRRVLPHVERLLEAAAE